MTNLSDSLQDKIQSETYGFFPIPITRYQCPNHDDLKKTILKWMAEESFLETHGREAISHNVKQVGPTNKLLLDCPEIEDALNLAISKHNQHAFNYKPNLVINESYVELHGEGAIYAPHEHSNCVYSLTYLINYNHEQHSFIKWRKNVASNHYPILQIESTDVTAFNLTEATFSMNEGDIIIYPANLTHGYDSNPNPERITLTANITISK